ncbi:MAG: carboxypeptidase regulatory-like domain-containing protein [Thiohalocapsa sp.]
MAIIQRSTTQRSTVMAMGLLLGGGVLTPVGAQPMHEAPLRPILGSGVTQVADASPTWAIRPADEANPLMQSTDTAVSPGVPSSEAGSSEIQSDGGIRYVSGGVGVSGRTDLEALSSQFNLHLMFATRGSGEYLSAVRVTILEAHKGTVLTAESNGPWFYAQLPPGNYSVEATPSGHGGEGQTQRKTARLDGSNQSKMDFYWEN